MGAIIERKGRYTALIRIKVKGKVVHSEAQTFQIRRDAVNWMKRREVDLAKPDALLPANDPPLSDVITRYIDESRKAMGRTKAQVLRTVAASDIGSARCSKLDSVRLIEYVQSLDCKPQTRANYVAHLASLFSIAKPAWGYPLDVNALRDCKVVCKKLGLTSKTRERTRRPTVAELDRILAAFEKRRGIPMIEVTLFALFSSRRQDEICRIRWDDLIPERQSVIVRDMKNPGGTVGNDVECHLPDEAWRVVMRQPRKADRIFPYSRYAVGKAFTETCGLLGIDDLHFHDLRHDAISRLFELGWDIPRVATVSAHKSWEIMRRYTHLRGMGDKYASWPPRLEIMGCHSQTQG